MDGYCWTCGWWERLDPRTAMCAWCLSHWRPAMPRYAIPRTAHCDSGALTMAARTRQDWQRWARRGSTTARGYGHQHQAERARRLQRYRPGDPCAHCGQPMTWWPLPVARRYIDLPHAPGKTGYLPGLAHRACNRRDGQRMTTAILAARRGTPARRWQSARQW